MTDTCGLPPAAVVTDVVSVQPRPVFCGIPTPNPSTSAAGVVEASVTASVPRSGIVTDRVAVPPTDNRLEKLSVTGVETAVGDVSVPALQPAASGRNARSARPGRARGVMDAPAESQTPCPAPASRRR